MKQFADISSYQTSIDWPTYAKWSDHVAIKVSEGVGFKDPLFESHRTGALAADIKSIWYYHYARPDLGNTAQAEAAWLHQTLGAIRPQDRIVLDLEQNAPNLTQWAHDFLYLLSSSLYRNYLSPVLYSYESFIKENLQSEELDQYPFWVASYTPDPPGSSMFAWQFTDKASVPGIVGPVDCSYYYGGDDMNWDAFNKGVVDLWNSQESYFKALGQELPPRDTGIFAMWRQAWLDGHFKGVPLSHEYPLNGEVAQNFAGGTATWINGKGAWL